MGTVAAICTPYGDGALGVIRISGEDAITVAEKVFFSASGKSLSALCGYSAAYGYIKDGENVLDDAVALVFRAPHSFTGENTVEISVHGGSIMTKEVLRLVTENGASLAGPGEFSKRAFLNGKTDLTKAESIMGLVSAKSGAELKLARAAHSGKIGEKIEKIEKDLVSLDASVAAYSDYPDEDIEGLNTENFEKLLSNAKTELEKMLSTFDAGRVLREGIETAIVGKPNVGKSTLMNMLSGTERSIVTEVAGTTRDVVEETVTIGEITLRLADTAGIHETCDEVEAIGVTRAMDRFKAAQLVLAVFDANTFPDEDDISLISQLDKENTIVVINKTDLKAEVEASLIDGFKTVRISAKLGDGYNELSDAVAEISKVAYLSADSVVLMNERQRECAFKALDGVNAALAALAEGQTVDAVGVCIDDAVSALYSMTGKRVTNEVTDEIFRKFCVGK